ncbi:MAG TPA: hypothetical protein VG269_03030 [Tepidisphaeraceae bacterium]|jgi:hypothetical protein|nr:hypothetical protein [Tepidisphaeraceae bacterium]
MKAQRIVSATAGLLLLTVAALWAHEKSVTAVAGADDKVRPDPQSQGEEGRAAKPATQPATPSADAGPAEEQWESFQAMHAYILNRFVKSDGFGLQRLPQVNDGPRSKRFYADGIRYWVGHVELISLNEGKEPFVYHDPIVADASKDRLPEAKHEPLAKGEAEALAQLKDGKEVVLMGAADKRELVGAVRATPDCMKCHHVKEGTLLGAFRYPLERVELPAEEQGK